MTVNMAYAMVAQLIISGLPYTPGADENKWYILAISLDMARLSENFCKWVASFLTRCRVGNVNVAVYGFSDHLPVNAGLPQRLCSV